MLALDKFLGNVGQRDPVRGGGCTFKSLYLLSRQPIKGLVYTDGKSDPPPRPTLHNRYESGFSGDFKLRVLSVMASLEKSRNSLQTGGWRRSSFHASL
jgi:hypothetical protein